MIGCTALTRKLPSISLNQRSHSLSFTLTLILWFVFIHSIFDGGQFFQTHSIIWWPILLFFCRLSIFSPSWIRFNELFWHKNHGKLFCSIVVGWSQSNKLELYNGLAVFLHWRKFPYRRVGSANAFDIIAIVCDETSVPTTNFVSSAFFVRLLTLNFHQTNQKKWPRNKRDSTPICLYRTLSECVCVWFGYCSHCLLNFSRPQQKEGLRRLKLHIVQSVQIMENKRQ